MKQICLLLVLAIGLVHALIADTTDAYATRYLKSYPQTMVQGLSAPLSWQDSDWLTAGTLVIATGALYLADEDIRRQAQNLRSADTDQLVQGISNFGDYRIITPAIGLVIGSGYIFNDASTLDTGLLSLKSLALSTCLVQGLKLGTQRNRPCANQGKEPWTNGSFSLSRDSFPSGHAQVVWCLAPVLAQQYRDSRWVAPTVYTIATATSLSRIYLDKHWGSDVLAGAVIGYVSANLVLKSTPRLQVMALPGLLGLGFSYTF